MLICGSRDPPSSPWAGAPLWHDRAHTHRMTQTHRSTVVTDRVVVREVLVVLAWLVELHEHTGTGESCATSKQRHHWDDESTEMVRGFFCPVQGQRRAEGASARLEDSSRVGGERGRVVAGGIVSELNRQSGGQSAGKIY